MNGNWRESMEKWKEGLGRYKYVLMVMALGVILLALPTGSGTEGQPDSQAAGSSDTFDLEAFEEKLERALSEIAGAGETRVVLALDSGSRQVLAQDREQDREGGLASSTVTLGRGAGSQEVVPLQTLAPSFRGALVVCPGGGDPQVRLELARAVSALTGLGADRISICEGNT